MMERLLQLNAAELLRLVESGNLDDREILEVLRNPYCTIECAERIADASHWLGSHLVRERLAAFRGLALGRVLGLLITLPWTSLLQLAQAPHVAPAVRRQAERRIRDRVPAMTLGEKVALARRAHRPIFPVLVETRDPAVLTALLDNPRLVENDVLVMLHLRRPPPELFPAVARHYRWGPSRAVRRALAENPSTPLPVALSAIVGLGASTLQAMASRPDVPVPVRDAAKALATRALLERRGVIP